MRGKKKTPYLFCFHSALFCQIHEMTNRFNEKEIPHFVRDDNSLYS